LQVTQGDSISINMTTFSQYLKEQFYNSVLHTRVYDHEGNMDRTVRNKLLEIAMEFAEKCGVDEHIRDVVLTGSLANFNYTKYSDLDVHLLLDFKDINDDEELVKKALDGQRFIWNMRHDIVIRGHEVELYFEDINEIHSSSGLYSLQEDNWIRKPKYDPPEVDERDVLTKARQYERDIALLKNRLDQVTDDEQARELHEMSTKLKNKIQKMRKDSLVREGEFGIGNLAFKHLRNTEAMAMLIDITSAAYDKQFSESSEVSFSTYSKEVY